MIRISGLGFLGQSAACSALAIALMAAPSSAFAQTAPAGAEDASADQSQADIVVTGSRIPRTGLTSTSPVATTTQEDIKLQSALTVEDFSVKLPQLAGGVRQASQGSDSFGAQVLDLRNFGQSRSLVLINGTRAVPFSFRNSVDINAIPASLIKQVDVLTGGAAAVYGADAVAGVVNFILNDDFKGLQVSTTGRFSERGGQQYGGSVMLGTGLGEDRGHLVIAADFTQRDQVLTGSRDWARTPGLTVPSVGGVFTDVASGRRFGFDANGQFTLTPSATSNISASYPLIEPLRRFNVAALYNYAITPELELYGRVTYTNARTQQSGTPGPNPPVIAQTVSISQTNPFLTNDIRNQLTFVGGSAQVAVSRSLAELGLITYKTERDTSQFQLGFRGGVTDHVKWNVYAQYGRSTELSPITGDGLVTNNAGANNFASIVNTVNIFGPNPALAPALGTTINGFNRQRDQLVVSGVLSGTTADFFSLPAGPIGFAAGFEYRRETGKVIQDSALLTGNTYRQGVQAGFDSNFDVREFYGELLVPVLHDTPFFKQLDIGGAYRTSRYDRFGVRDTWKAEINWAVDDNVRFRGTIQRVIRTPNFGEFAAATSSLPFNALITVPRLTPRYAGDPCVLGTGNTAQCQRFGAPAVGSANSFDPTYLEGSYFYGGNATISPETGKTYTAGAVLTPQFLPGFSLTVDWYKLNLQGAVGVIQPVAAITSCYITNPVADNPLCQLVTRNPANGHFRDAFVNNQNLGRITQEGLDIAANYTLRAGWVPGDGLRLSYQANIVTSYVIQANSTVAPVQCKGTYGATCSSDGTTLVQPDYRHDASVSWLFNKGQVQLNWQRIGSVRNSAAGQTGKLPAQNIFDLTGSYGLNKWLTVSGGIYNLFDKSPPIVATGGVFNTFPDTYDVLGRTYGLSLTARF